MAFPHNVWCVWPVHLFSLRPIVSPTGLTPAVKGLGVATPGSGSAKKKRAAPTATAGDEAVSDALGAAAL